MPGEEKASCESVAVGIFVSDQLDGRERLGGDCCLPEFTFDVVYGDPVHVLEKETVHSWIENIGKFIHFNKY